MKLKCACSRRSDAIWAIGRSFWLQVRDSMDKRSSCLCVLKVASYCKDSEGDSKNKVSSTH